MGVAMEIDVEIGFVVKEKLASYSEMLDGNMYYQDDRGPRPSPRDQCCLCHLQVQTISLQADSDRQVSLCRIRSIDGRYVSTVAVARQEHAVVDRSIGAGNLGKYVQRAAMQRGGSINIYNEI
jgi:hypothetical protein